MQILGDFKTSLEKALTEIDPKWKNYKGLIICGTHTPHNTEEMIMRVQVARKTGLPFLGICFGHQLAFIEWCRFKGIKDATSEEFGKGTFVVKKRKEGLKVGLHEGESWWNNYEIDETLDWTKPSNFITCQYHPEYQSSAEKPHPLLVKFIEICRSEKQNH